MKRLVALGLAVTLVLAACGIEVGDVRVGPPPICETTSRGMLILMAQAVPAAELIPCISDMPEGWTIERAEIGTNRAELSFDGGQVGDVIVVLSSACHAIGEPATNDTGHELAVFEDQANDMLTRNYVFAGGCISVEAPDRLAASEMTREISFITRDGLRRVSGLEL